MIALSFRFVSRLAIAWISLTTIAIANATAPDAPSPAQAATFVIRWQAEDASKPSSFDR